MRVQVLVDISPEFISEGLRLSDVRQTLACEAISEAVWVTRLAASATLDISSCAPPAALPVKPTADCGIGIEQRSLRVQKKIGRGSRLQFIKPTAISLLCAQLGFIC